MHLQVVDSKVGVVGFVAKIIGGVQFEAPSLLLQFQGGSALRPSTLETCREVHTVRHNDGDHRGAMSASPVRKFQVLRMHFESMLPLRFTLSVRSSEFSSHSNEKAPELSVKRKSASTIRVSFRTGMNHQRTDDR